MQIERQAEQYGDLSGFGDPSLDRRLAEDKQAADEFRDLLRPPRIEAGTHLLLAELSCTCCGEPESECTCPEDCQMCSCPPTEH